MKQKDVIQLAIAMIILVGAGYFIFTLAVPHGKGGSKSTSYEVVTKIDSGFDKAALDKLSDPTVARDFYTKPDLHNGVGNPQPFTPLK